MIDSPVPSRTLHFHTPLPLSCGASLQQYRIVYETYGRLNDDRSNAVLVCHALNGSHHAAGRSEDPGLPSPKGWWDNMIGPGKPVDTNRFFVVAACNIGSCFGSTGPASPKPDTDEPYGASFPSLAVEDWVDAQARLLDRLGIRRLAAVIGGSMGGMQALCWAVRYPDRLRHCVAIATCPNLSAQNIAFNEIARRAIQADPAFHGGNYLVRGTAPREGLAIARMLGHATYVSEPVLQARFGREPAHPETAEEFVVESYLRGQADRFASYYDANTYLLITRALDRFDLAACASASAPKLPLSTRFLLVSFSSDWRFPPRRSEEIASFLLSRGADVEYHEVAAPNGHDAFLMDHPRYHEVIAQRFRAIAAQVNAGTEALDACRG